MSSAPQPSFLTQLTGTIDRLDPVLDPIAARRQQLIQSAKAICEQQQLSVTEETVAHAVDQEMQALPRPVDASGSISNFNFGWNRPSSAKDLATRRKPRFWQKITGFLGADTFSALFSIFVSLVVLGVFAIVQTGNFHQTERGAGLVFVTVQLSAVFTVVINVLAQMSLSSLRAVGVADIPAGLVNEKWAKHPAIRAYVRQCLLSPVPEVLNGDVEQIGHIQEMIETSAAQIQAAQNKVANQQQLNSALWTLAQVEETAPALS